MVRVDSFKLRRRAADSQAMHFVDLLLVVLWLALDAAGYGKASGCGYHKESAAFEAALRSAEVRLANNISGAGDQEVHEAMHAIANACGFADCHIRRIV